MVVGERQRRGVEGVGGDEVRAGFEELAVNVFDDLGPGQHQQVVATLEIVRPVLEPLAAERGFIQPVLLDHRAHGAVENDDALGEQLAQGVRRDLLIGHRLFIGRLARCRSDARRAHGRWRR